MSDLTQRQRAEAVVDTVKAELPPIWLGGRQRMVLVDEITQALTTARQEALRECKEAITKCFENGPSNDLLTCGQQLGIRAALIAIETLDRLAREGREG